MVASAATFRMNSSAKTWRFGDEQWQREAWRLYDIIGELRFVSNWIGGAVSHARLYVAEVDDSGEATEEVAEQRVAELAAVPLGVGSGKDENLRLLAIDLFVPGEGYIVSEDDGESGRWWVVSGGEISRTGGQLLIPRPQRFGGGRMTFRDGRDTLLRVWTPHPRKVGQADSPTRSAIPALREVELLMKREFAELDSRLTGAGVWFLPQGLDFPRTDEDPPGIKGFMAYVARAAEASMADQSSASAMVPVMATVPDHLVEFLDRFKDPTTFWSELSEQLTQLKDQAVRRIAMALDIPPEILVGVGTSNRWNAWLADEQVIKIHVAPMLARIADALTIGYLHPALEEMGLDPDRFVFAFDTAPLTVRPNRSEDAMSFWDRLMMSDEAALEAGAFGVEVLPDSEERGRRLVEQLVMKEPQLLANEGVQKILGLDIGSPANEQDGRPREIERSDPEDSREAPDSQDDEPERDDPNRDREAATRAVAALAVLRALEVAGSRLAGTSRFKHPDVPRYRLNQTVGPVSEDRAAKALEGAWDHLDVIAAETDIDAEQLRRTLHGYCTELLRRGLPHSDDLLSAALTVAAHAHA